MFLKKSNMEIIMKLVKTLTPIVSIVLLSGCISSAPIVPVTPANQNQISVCQADATLHNDVVIGDFVVGGLTSGLAGVSAGLPNTDSSAKTAIAISAAVGGALTITGAAIAGYTASNFSNSNCSSVVGILPSPTSLTPTPAPVTTASTAVPFVTPMSVVVTPPVPAPTAPIPVVAPIAVTVPAPTSVPSKTPVTAPKK
jgi:hypothetical protein